MSNTGIATWDGSRARVVTFANQKGGVAKSTSAEAFAASLAARGYAVLMVDTDAQPGNLSLHVGTDKDLPGAYELVAQRRPTYEGAVACVQPTRSFGDVICADERLDGVDDRLNARVGREFTLLRALAPLLPEYDFVVVDTPPALQVRTLNALAAADDVIVPCSADVSSVAGMGELLDCASQVAELAGGHGTRVAGVLVTRYDARNNLEPEMLGRISDLAAECGVPVLEPCVRATVSARKAQRAGVALRDFAPRSTAALDYECAVDGYLAGIGVGGGGEDGKRPAE